MTSVYGEWLRRLLTDAELAAKITKKLEKRIDKSAGEDGCWTYTGQRLPRGYGVIHIGYTKDPDGRERHGKNYAHRVAYVLHHRRLPEGSDVCHRCDNPPCCNPAHLFAGSRSDNMKDMIAKGRGRSIMAPGALAAERNPAAKYTAEQARAVVSMSRDGVTRALIMRELGVSKGFVDKVRGGQAWQSVTGITPSTAIKVARSKTYHRA